jgi:hypothetical protein
VVLRPELGAALERARTRAGPSRTAPEPIRSLYEQLNWLGPLEAGVIDTTYQAPAETVSAVRDLLAGGTPRVDVGQVNANNG